jgi:hypothetical protein
MELDVLSYKEICMVSAVEVCRWALNWASGCALRVKSENVLVSCICYNRIIVEL